MKCHLKFLSLIIQIIFSLPPPFYSTIHIFFKPFCFFMWLTSPVFPKFFSLIFAIVKLSPLLTCSSVFFQFLFYKTIKNPYFEEVVVVGIKESFGIKN